MPSGEVTPRLVRLVGIVVSVRRKWLNAVRVRRLHGSTLSAGLVVSAVPASGFHIDGILQMRDATTRVAVQPVE